MLAGQQSLASASRMCDDNYTVEFNNVKCYVTKAKFVVNDDEFLGIMNSVHLQRASNKTLETPNVTMDMFSVSQSALEHADRNVITRMAKSGTVRSLETTVALQTIVSLVLGDQ